MAYEEANEDIAYGLCGLLPEQFYRLTPAEFFKIMKGKIAEAKRQRDIFDALNARQCLNRSRLAGDDKSTLEDFMIYREKKKMTTDQIVRVMDSAARVGGSHE
jgi:hypothetical protein